LQPKDRYDAVDLDENQFEPGSRRRVLKNLLSITLKREMDQLEGHEQVRALEALAASYDQDHQFTAADVCRIHQVWLGRIYSWGGAGWDGSQLRSNDQTIYRGDREDLTGSREGLRCREALGSECKSAELSFTPSISVEVYTVI
jgi:hypothetical protein